jgi:hemerythrin-like domain-containing protein
MKPIGPLMREHRLIERMVRLMDQELSKIRNGEEVSAFTVNSAVDFFRTYADRTHHGKEEDILFKQLSRKRLTSEHKRIMDELTEEHIFAKKKVRGLKDAMEAFAQKDGESSLDDIAGCLAELVKLYPAHIQKEDKHFFYPCLDYFTKEEQDRMLEEFADFDKKMIHEKYNTLVEGLEKDTLVK